MSISKELNKIAKSIMSVERGESQEIPFSSIDNLLRTKIQSHSKYKSMFGDSKIISFRKSIDYKHTAILFSVEGYENKKDSIHSPGNMFRPDEEKSKLVKAVLDIETWGSIDTTKLSLSYRIQVKDIYFV